MKFKEGEEISIGGIRHKISRIILEVDKWDSEKQNGEGWHNEIQIHEKFLRLFSPTHMLKIYEYNREIIFYEIGYEKIDSSKLFNPKKVQPFEKYRFLRELEPSNIKKL